MRAYRVEFSRMWIIENFETFFDSDSQRVGFWKNQQVNWSAGSKLLSLNFGVFDSTFLYMKILIIEMMRLWTTKNNFLKKKWRNFQSQSCFAHASSALRALRSKRISYRSTNLLDHSSTPTPSFGECVVIEASTIVGPQFLFALLCVRLCLFWRSRISPRRIIPVAEVRTT